MNQNKTLLQRVSAVPHIVWTVLFILVPLVFIAYYAFTDRNFSFTVEYFKTFFTPYYFSIFLRSIKLALIATIICLIIGYPAAYFMSRASARAQTMLMTVIMMPMWMNFLLRTFSLVSIFKNDTGLLNALLTALHLPNHSIFGTETAIVIGMVYDFLPYMILPIFSVMVKIDSRLIEAAGDLGCNSAKTMLKVVMPLSVPGVISGFTMVFVPSISTFYISQQLSGNKIQLIGDIIEVNYYQDPHFAAAFSFALMSVLLISIAVMSKFSDNESGGRLS